MVRKGNTPRLAFHQVECSTKFVSGKVEDFKKTVKAMKNIPAHKTELNIEV